jgi:HD-GYP domain-containing protein (c-di-GMP phosphodiesterase class II)
VSRDNLYKSILVSSFIDDFPLNFPVFIKNRDNYILYKPAGELFTRRDIERLNRSSTEFIYLRYGDMEVFTRQTEEVLENIVANKNYSVTKKIDALFTVSTNYISEIYNNPIAVSSNIDRCRTLVDSIITSCLNNPNVFKEISKIIVHNGYEYAHAIHVVTLSLVLAHRMYNLDHDELSDLGTGAILHDIGKIFIPDEIINKPESLTDKEYDIMKDHTVFGYDYIKETISNEVILSNIRDHHERLDGRGYPRGIEGDQIGRNTRIINTADVYSALIADRPYRKGHTPEEALQIMKDQFVGRAISKELYSAMEEYTLSLD